MVTENAVYDIDLVEKFPLLLFSPPPRLENDFDNT